MEALRTAFKVPKLLHVGSVKEVTTRNVLLVAHAYDPSIWRN